MRDLPPRVLAALAVLALSGACSCEEGDGIRALAPSIVVTPERVDFGPTWLGMTFRRTVTVRNAGDAALTVRGLRLSPASDPGLDVDGTGFGLAPGASQSVELRYVPSAMGRAAGLLLVESDDPARPLVEVEIVSEVGRKPGPGIQVCVESAELGLAETCSDTPQLDFGPVPLGEARTGVIRVRSVGTEPLNVTSGAPAPRSDPAFGFDPNPLSGSVAVDASVEVQVRFEPTTAQGVSAVFSILSDDPDRSPLPVVLTGGAQAPALCPSAAAIDFGTVPVGMSAERTLTLESCGDAPLRLDAWRIFGNPSEFEVLDALAMATVLAPGETRDVRLRYTPVDPGPDRDRFVLESAIADGFIELSGRGDACDLQVVPSRVSFGGVASGRSAQRAVSIENAGGVACSVTRLALAAGTSGEFAIVAPPSLPATIAPGASLAVDLSYSPADSGSDMGALEIDGSDPGEPTLRVDLEGRRLGIGECTLAAVPDPVAFGAVPMGMPRTIGVQIRNDGTSLCTVLNVALGSGTSPDFRLMPPGAPIVIRSGQTRSVDITYDPLDPGRDTGSLEVFSLNPVTPTLVVPLSGTGSGPKLCLDPNPVVFGSHTIGIPVRRTARLVACGTEAVVVSRLELPSPTSAEFALPAPPSLPLTIPAGTDAPIELVYTGADLGRDDGRLRVHSNDAIEPQQDLELVAATGDGPCGDLMGRICGLDGAGPVAGAQVSVVANGTTYSATTNAAGDFVLTCVPPGTYQVEATSGQWSTRFTAQITVGQTTSIPGQQCLDVSSARVAVVGGEWDRIEGVLDGLNVPYTLYTDMGYSGGDRLILNRSELAMYDIVFVNCGVDETSLLSSAAQANLRDFVANGGSFYASDWAYDLIERTWPSAIDFHGDDATVGAAQSAGNFTGNVDVVDASLRRQLGGRAQVSIASCCSAVDQAGPGTSTYLEGDRLNDNGRHPFMVGFQPDPTGGRVFYTDFHNDGQQDILDIFRWLITQL